MAGRIIRLKPNADPSRSVQHTEIDRNTGRRLVVLAALPLLCANMHVSVNAPMQILRVLRPWWRPWFESLRVSKITGHS